MNPWLDIPLEDYEAHMASAAVGQAAMLSELFGEVLALLRPASVAVLGIAGGNGLERIDSARTRRVVGIDLNRDYLDEVQQRFGSLPGLELHRTDLSNEVIELEPVELVHAALIFEHAGVERCLENALAFTSPHGALSVVLQLPSVESAHVGSSGVESIVRLASHFSLVQPSSLTGTLAERGLFLAHERTAAVAAGKRLWLGVFKRA